MSIFFAAVTLALILAPAWAQTAPPAQPKWEYYGSAFGYVVPDGRSYVQPTFTADKESLHVEARYNYEGLETGSLWLGRNFSFGDKATLDVTPMLGGVFGKTNGVAPGYNASLAYKRLSFDTQGEYLFQLDRTSDFFYVWSELSYSPFDWLRAGVAIQRTKAYQTKLDTQRGLLAGVAYKNIDFTAYVFNLGWGDVTKVFALGVRF